MHGSVPHTASFLAASPLKSCLSASITLRLGAAFFHLVLKIDLFSVPQQQGGMNCIIYVLIKNQGRAEVGLGLCSFSVFT